MQLDRNFQDMAWCVQSAPLIRTGDHELWPSDDWFSSWDLSGISARQPEEYKLGLRFESIVAAWIEQEPSLQLVTRNQPIRDGERTVGEFDVIVENNGSTEHWELAVKFYIGVDDLDDMGNWFGPDPSDTLAKKINRMESHQLALSQQPAAMSWLEQQGIDIRTVRSFTKGRLYHPFLAFRMRESRVPQGVNPDHEKGWWLTSTGFTLQADLERSQFIVLERPEWLAPIVDADETRTISHEQLSEQVKAMVSGTLHVAQLDSDRNEVSRGFIVSGKWLADVEREQAAASQS